MKLPDHRTKIVCTIGPASSPKPVLRQLILKGMNVARINFSHGDLEKHREVIHRIRSLSTELGVTVAILADLPGPRIRVGDLENEPLTLEKGDTVYLTPLDIEGGKNIIPVNYKRLYESVSPGSNVFLNDGFIQLRCLGNTDKGVECKVEIGGYLTSHKGVNLPGSRIFLDAVTDDDLRFMKFALDEGINIFSLSFVESASDIEKLRNFAQQHGESIYVVAKIEREEAVQNIDDILEHTDAIMLARGDLGVETPIQQVPVLQKEIIHKANLRGKPVITATHMLESMTENIRPTRAEATDVSNAILDGTDALMLSGETAVGKYPIETVLMMTGIASSTEKWRNETGWGTELLTKGIDELTMSVSDVIALQVYQAIKRLKVEHTVTPTISGQTPRRISRFKPDCWIFAMSRRQEICETLALSYGVYPIYSPNKGGSWEQTASTLLKGNQIASVGDLIVFTEGQSPGKPGGTNMLKILQIE